MPYYTDSMTTRSQAGRDLTDSPVHLTYSKQSRLTRLLRTLPSWVSNISRDGYSTVSLGKLVYCSITLRVKQHLFLNGMSFWFGLFFPLVKGITEKSLTSSSLLLSITYLYILTIFPLSLLFSRLHNPSSLTHPHGLSP